MLLNGVCVWPEAKTERTEQMIEKRAGISEKGGMGEECWV